MCPARIREALLQSTERRKIMAEMTSAAGLHSQTLIEQIPVSKRTAQEELVEEMLQLPAVLKVQQSSRGEVHHINTSLWSLIIPKRRSSSRHSKPWMKRSFGTSSDKTTYRGRLPEALHF